MIESRVICGLLAGVLSACGGGGSGSGGDEVTIIIHKNFPFVDGDTADEAEFVAVQDGDGAFVEVFGTDGVYNAPITSERFGIAVGCNDIAGSFVDIEIVQRTVVDDLTYKTFCKTQPATATLNVTVVNLPPDQRLRLRTNRNIQNALSDGTVEIVVPSGETELFGTLTDANRNVLKLFRIPAIQVATTADVTIDVATDGVAPDNTRSFTLTPDDPDALFRTAVVRPYGSVTLTGATNPIGANRNYMMVPPALQQPDDLFRFTVTGATGSTGRTAKAPGTLAFTLPDAFVAQSFELIETPFLRPVFTFDPTPAVLENQSYIVDASNFNDIDVTLFRTWFATLSSSWIGDAPTVRYEFPDLSGMPNFDDVALVANERLDTTIIRLETTLEFNEDGAESTSSSAGGVVGKFCGDGAVIAPEVCDPGDGFETATCDFDCTAAECGDNVVNGAAGEECDPPDGTTCGLDCKVLPPR